MSLTQTPEEKLCSRSWRIRNSGWVLTSILSAGFLTWTGFLYTGLKSKNRRFLIAAAGWGAWMLINIVWSNNVPSPEKGQPGTAASDLYSSFLVIGYIASIIHQCVWNKQWLRWRAHYRPWYTSASSSVANPSTPDLEHRIGAVFGGVQTASAMPPKRGTQKGWGMPAPSMGQQRPANELGRWGRNDTEGPHERQMALAVDINTSPAAELVSAGFSRTDAERIVESRNRFGSFSTPADLVARGIIAPHVYQDLRHGVTVAMDVPPAQPAPTRGESTPRHGRRLDF